MLVFDSCMLFLRCGDGFRGGRGWALLTQSLRRDAEHLLWVRRDMWVSAAFASSRWRDASVRLCVWMDGMGLVLVLAITKKRAGPSPRSSSGSGYR